MSEFKKGQLVAVQDFEDSSWTLAKYDRKEGGGHVVKRISGGILVAAEAKYSYCAPAEVIWPSLFVSVDREIIDSLTAERDRLERQVEWLVRILYADYGECPPHKHLGDPCTEDKGCEVCWIKASVEAAERMKKCQSTQE